MAHHRPLGDPLPGINQYTFPPRKGQQDLSPGGRKNMAAIGSMRKKLSGFSEEGDDDYGSAGMYFNPSMFPPHRSDKEAHLGGLYGTPSGMQSPGPHQTNFYSSGLPSSGLPPSVNSMQVPPNTPRGMSSAQFGRSLSHPGPTHSTSTMSGSITTPGVPSVHNMGGLQGGNLSSQSASRGILSMGPRGVMGQMPPGSGHLGSQSGLNNLPKTSRAISLPSSLSSGTSRSSPIPTIGMTLSQAPQQQQTHQARDFNLGGSSTSSVTGAMSSFGLSRSQSTSGSSQGMSGPSLPLFSGTFAPPGAPDSPKSLRHIFSGAGQGLSDAQGNNSVGLDLSEFPALANRSRLESLSRVEGVPRLESIGGVSAPPGSIPSRPSYGVVSKPAEPQPDFSIHNEDFPALPGSNNFKSENNTESSTSQDPSKQQAMSTSSSVFPGTDLRGGASYEQALKDVAKDARFIAGESKSNSSNHKQPLRGIQTSPSGMISNIPKGMVTDQFGMIGLLTFIRAAETEPNLVTLALGSDLTTLGLNLNSPESLYHTFGSPFADSPCRPHEIDYHVPSEYRINSFIRDKLAPIKPSRYSEDLLFYLYYTNGGDILQLAAAAELYARDWRYHKEERLWLTRAPGVEPQLKTSSYERGTYYFFDCSTWRKVAKEFHLEYDKLDDKPTLQSVTA